MAFDLYKGSDTGHAIFGLSLLSRDSHYIGKNCPNADTVYFIAL